MKNGAMMIFAAFGLLLMFQQAGHSQPAPVVAGRYAMYINDRDGRNYLLDTQTGDSWTMIQMSRKNRFIGVWKPNIRTNNFEEEDRIFNNSANSFAIVQPIPGK